MSVSVNNSVMRAEMARNRMTISALKEVTGISKATISSIRNGKSCSVETAIRIAEALKINITDLLESEENT